MPVIKFYPSLNKDIIRHVRDTKLEYSFAPSERSPRKGTTEVQEDNYEINKNNGTMWHRQSRGDQCKQYAGAK